MSVCQHTVCEFHTIAFIYNNEKGFYNMKSYFFHPWMSVLGKSWSRLFTYQGSHERISIVLIKSTLTYSRTEGSNLGGDLVLLLVDVHWEKNRTSTLWNTFKRNYFNALGWLFYRWIYIFVFKVFSKVYISNLALHYKNWGCYRKYIFL